MFREFGDAVHATGACNKFGVQLGASSIGPEAPLRATLNLPSLLEHVDLLFSGAQGNAPHEFF